MSPGRIVRSISDGSVAIVRWTYGRLAALRTADGDPVLPVALALLAASALTAAVAAAPLIAAGAWIVAAWIAAPAVEEAEEDGDDGEEEGEEDPVEGAEEVAEEGPEVVPVEAPLPTREELATALYAVADPNVHTAALAAHMKLPAERVRAALKAAGIPAGGQVRMGGVPSTGIKAADFPPLPPSGEGAPEPVVVAGQASNNDSNNAPRVVTREGMTIIHDPAETHRHHRVA
ncbi:hypothetical protein CLM85_31175 [Streptomyces albidoflavus]|uniref:hypothetical protein n=1 Tax=Streptomyces albidoflavus TaxID=1886 RepID=UPI000BAE209B|nr:hypothetical protein [Streptomyces albidoflavus]PAX92682.1 hypothetical protein CLM82_01870 [Streptomyces albidoflavus]PBO17700.1 hypothetical protein CLM83_16365 [Streptomyces albidoflavus]PBO20941.1 hypothetical protein CLM85_31175 [Streptomyces albidoflavus]PBO29750.1 hypothetical protein CLM84_12255 [Streptomyces albidoflavus]